LASNKSTEGSQFFFNLFEDQPGKIGDAHKYIKKIRQKAKDIGVKAQLNMLRIERDKSSLLKDSFGF